MNYIKKVFLAIFTIALFNSCGGGDGIGTNAQESKEIIVTSTEISIDRAQVVMGNPPVPNEQISMLDLPSKVSAVQNVGFSLEVKSPTDIDGAYVQIQGSDEYYDVNVYSYSSSRATRTSSFTEVLKNDIKFHREEIKARISKTPTTSTTSAEIVQEAELEFEFPNDLEPGTFCFDICIYDDQGNISAPQTVCVVVEAWGGNSSLVGNWKMDKFLHDDGNVQVIGKEYCDAYSDCYTDCSTFYKLEFKIKSDGTYQIYSESKYKDFNHCESGVVEYESNGKYKTIGNWAYDDINKNLVLVATHGEDTREGEETIYTDFKEVDGELSAGELQVESVSRSKLVFSEYDDWDESTTYYHFKK
ncbi:hypothetical protein [Wenyingzhuangia sp. IMCC45574]